VINNLEGISIIVCCYNSASRLADTLTYIANQEATDSFRWEVIVVNNNSTDNTAEIAEREWHRLSKHETLTIVNEKQAGLSFAREKGIAESRFEYIILCDDDNWLSPNYLNEVFSLFTSHPEVDVIGSMSMPSYETVPPEWFKKNHMSYALGSQVEKGDITNGNGSVWGAGMAIRKSKLNVLKNTGYKNLLTDRLGGKMTTGGDTEICYSLRAIGSRIYFTQRCWLIHFMPKNRFNLQKFYELNFQNGYSGKYLECLYNIALPSKKGLLKDIYSDLSKYHIKYLILRFLLQKIDFALEVKFQELSGNIMGNIFIIKNYKRVCDNIRKLRTFSYIN